MHPRVLSRKWTSRWTRTAPWTWAWRSPSNTRAVCPAPVPGFDPRTLLPLLPRSITVEAAGWHHQTFTHTSRRSGRDLWITPNPTAKGRRKWTRSVQLRRAKERAPNTQCFPWYYSQRKCCNINNNRQNSPKAFWRKKKLLLVYITLSFSNPLALFPVPLSSFYYSFISQKYRVTVQLKHCTM